TDETGVLELHHRALEAELELLLLQLGEARADLGVVPVPDVFSLHLLPTPRAPNAYLELAVTNDELALDGQLGGGELHGALGHILRHALELEHDPARLHHGDPGLRVSLPLPHPRLRGLGGDRLVGENPDPDLAATLDVAGHGDTSRLDLPVRDPRGLQGLQPVLTERHLAAPVRGSAHAALVRLPVLDPLRR